MVCKDESGYIMQLKQQNSKRWYYLSAHWLSGNVLLSNITFFDFCSFSCVMQPLSSLQTVLNCEVFFNNKPLKFRNILISLDSEGL